MELKNRKLGMIIMMELKVGIYDLLHTVELQKRLEKKGLLDSAVWSKFSYEDLKHRLAIPIAKEIASYLSDILIETKEEKWVEAVTEVFQSHEKVSELLESLRPVSAQSLHQIKTTSHEVLNINRPDTPLSVSTLLTGSSRSPALRSQLIKELGSCERADWLVSFIKYSGIMPIFPALVEFTRTPNDDGGPKLRIATTSYMGATDYKAIVKLLSLPNTEIKMSYDTKRTRLHAKAYLFCRKTGFSTAYIGSANISKAALDEGLEWTVKVSQYETEHLWQHAQATFESHWEDETEFSLLKEENLPELKLALQHEMNPANDEMDGYFADLRPLDFQKIVLEDIEAERAMGKNKHLIVSATGTGKTMIAAFDYQRFSRSYKSLPRLLFVAHREEILKQARSAFRQVLKDGSFGEIVISGNTISQENHFFCSVQSWNSREFYKYPADYFDYIVLDEAHHASADSYQRILTHITPKVLLGLTATPERMDGSDIKSDFGGSFTHEIRLADAIDRALLVPFHYYGIPDLEGIDYSDMEWERGGYKKSELQKCLDHNGKRADWVLGQMDKYLMDIRESKCLGFCVSIEHAKFMAEYFKARGINAEVLTSESDPSLRKAIHRRLEQGDINVVFTVDLYNEGIDIPIVDVVLFLRPTESLTVFLQQLGRGLRLNEGKSHLTVLDFIAPQNRRFNFAQRYKALSSRPDIRIDTQVEKGMPYLPNGCLISLEKQASEYIIRNIRDSVSMFNRNRLIIELNELRNKVKGRVDLKTILSYLCLDNPDEIYKRDLPHRFFKENNFSSSKGISAEDSERLAKGFRRLLLMDDNHFISYVKKNLRNSQSVDKQIELLHALLWGQKSSDIGTLTENHNLLLTDSDLMEDLNDLLEWLLETNKPLPEKRFEQWTGPLNLHASYTRQQILMAIGACDFNNPVVSQAGVHHSPEKKIDVFFADIHKSRDDFSDTTMYDDFALSENKFHWQSQSTTGVNTSVGQRYINHAKMHYTPLLFIRDRRELANGITAPYFFAGPLSYNKHEGSKPISFVWDMIYSLPARVLSWARRIA